MRSLISIAILVFSLFASAKKPLNDLEKVGLKGSIKEVKEYVYSASGEQIPALAGKTEVFSYNLQGYLISVSESDITGKILRKSAFLYDQHQNLLERKWFGEGESLISRTVYQYDQNGNAIERNSYGPDGKNLSRIVSEFDELGKLTAYKTFLPDGELYNIHFFKYNPQGLEVEEVISYPDGSVEWRSASEYDKSGRLIRKNENPSCCIGREYIYGYNEEGDLIFENSIKADGSKGIKYTYLYKDFDKNGNWLTKTISENDQPSAIIKREIRVYRPQPH